MKELCEAQLNATDLLGTTKSKDQRNTSIHITSQEALVMCTIQTSQVALGPPMTNERRMTRLRETTDAPGLCFDGLYYSYSVSWMIETIEQRNMSQSYPIVLVGS